MPVSEDMLKEISARVRSGFYFREQIISIFCEERRLERSEVEVAVDAALESHNAQKSIWPEVTDFDRLDDVFRNLRSIGIIALHNAGHEHSDGYTEVAEAHAQATDRRHIIGYCFYHWQDVQGAIDGIGLYIAFGPIDPNDADTRGPWIGRIIAEELRRAGFKIAWDGTFKTRILIAGFDWKRR